MDTLIHKQIKLSKTICSLDEDEKIKILNTPHVQAVGTMQKINLKTMQ